MCKEKFKKSILSNLQTGSTIRFYQFMFMNVTAG